MEDEARRIMQQSKRVVIVVKASLSKRVVIVVKASLSNPGQRLR